MIEHNKDNLIEKEEKLNQYNGFDRIVSSIDKVKEIKDSPENEVCFNTGFPKLDELVGGLEGGELIALTGKYKSGKSSFSISLTRNVLKQGYHVLWFQYELNHRQFFRNFGGIVPLFYLPNEITNKNLNWIEERIHEAILKYDVKLVIIDNIHFLIDYEKKENVTTKIEEIVRRLKRIAIDFNIVILVMSHARRLIKGEIEDEDMFKGSSALAAESDKSWVISRIRDDNGEFGTKAQLKVCLDRKTGSMSKVINLHFDPEKKVFYEEEILIPEENFNKSKEDLAAELFNF